MVRVGDYVIHKGAGTLGKIRKEIPPDKFYTMKDYEMFKFYLVDWGIEESPVFAGYSRKGYGYVNIQYHDEDGTHTVYLDTGLELAPQYNTKLGSLW